MFAIVDIWVFMGKSQHRDFPWKNHDILDIHGKSKLFWISMKIQKISWIFLENPNYFGYPQTIQHILNIHRKSIIIEFHPWENNNFAQTIYTNKKIEL